MRNRSVQVIIRHGMETRRRECAVCCDCMMDEQLCSGAAVGRRGIVRAVGRSPRSGDGGALRLKCSEELGGDRRRRSPLREHEIHAGELREGFGVVVRRRGEDAGDAGEVVLVERAGDVGAEDEILAVERDVLVDQGDVDRPLVPLFFDLLEAVHVAAAEGDVDERVDLELLWVEMGGVEMTSWWRTRWRRMVVVVVVAWWWWRTM